MQNTFSKYKQTDKLKYLDFYQRYFSNLNPTTLLEIGVLEGDSLRIWKEIFPNTQVVGIDTNPEVKKYKDLDIFIGDQRDIKFLDFVIASIGHPDIIIDDGGHTRTCQTQSLIHLFPLLKSKGLYIIEDLETSYLEDFNDYAISTVSYLKTLITPLNFISTKRPPPSRVFNYFAESIVFEPNICLLRKK